MATRETEAFEAGMSLPSDARKRLAIRLLESVEVVDDESVDTAWRDEISSRFDEIHSGKAKAVPHEEVLTPAGRASCCSSGDATAVTLAINWHPATEGALVVLAKP